MKTPKFNRMDQDFAPSRKPFFNRPHWTRRQFFQIAGTGLTGSYLVQRYARAAEVMPSGVTTQNTAQNVIFILLAGAPSHVDTFDLKFQSGVTPDAFAPATINGIAFPTGLLPGLAQQLQNNNFSIVRSMRSHALVHSLAQTWTQIGRNPAAALGNIAPNIGSVVAIEKDSQRLPGQVFPTFLALNSPSGVGQGYFSAQFAPFRVIPSTNGLPDTILPGDTTGAPGGLFDTRWSLLHQLDDPLRVNSPYGQPLNDYNNFYLSARDLMYNPVVNQAFKFASADHTRYGATSFGDACLIAKQVLAANQGTRFIQITVGGWDMHQNIYTPNQLPGLGKQLDTAVSQLISDLQSAGLFNETLVFMAGEFGRTVGQLTPAKGRDHYPQQFAFFAGGGIKGGQAIGQTNSDGSDTVDFGWSQQRYVYPEDIEATIYSALGIDWTTVRQDDPLHRGFAYVPDTDPVQYAPINELWPPGS
ncbi:MAG TPA: DUF1501 domain-containing protein [Bryobacteraceae bacterium]|nr:DUF1501 domain-containing protein [Bryobacteraceae bacterium]